MDFCLCVCVRERAKNKVFSFIPLYSVASAHALTCKCTSKLGCGFAYSSRVLFTTILQLFISHLQVRQTLTVQVREYSILVVLTGILLLSLVVQHSRRVVLHSRTIVP